MNHSGAAGSYLTFHSGDEIFAADANGIAEVFRLPPLTRVPHSPPSLLGMAGLRGMAVPVISLARLLGQEDSATEATRLLLLRGEHNIGLVVDRIGAVTALPDEPAEAANGKRNRNQIYNVAGGTARVLDLPALLRRDFAGTRGRAEQNHAPAAAMRQEDASAVALLAFDLAGQSYALPLQEIEEVRKLPPQLAAIAQSDKAVLGVARSGERVLPVVSARHLLGLPPAPADAMAVIRLGADVIGLAVDRLRAIVRVPESAIDVAPALLNRGAGEAQVHAICRPPGSAGLLAILSRERLFRNEKIASILAAGPSEGETMTEDRNAPKPSLSGALQFLIFRLGDEEYGLPLACVDEVARLPERLTRVPRAPAFIEGVFNLRGKLVPVIDQRQRFGAQGESRADRRRVVITAVEGRQAGFIVDSVKEILLLTQDQLGPTPELTAEAGRLFTRIATLDQGARLILLIEPREMLDRAERDLLGALETAAPAEA